MMYYTLATVFLLHAVHGTLLHLSSISLPLYIAAPLFHSDCDLAIRGECTI